MCAQQRQPWTVADRRHCLLALVTSPNESRLQAPSKGYGVKISCHRLTPIPAGHELHLCQDAALQIKKPKRADPESRAIHTEWRRSPRTRLPHVPRPMESQWPKLSAGMRMRTPSQVSTLTSSVRGSQRTLLSGYQSSPPAKGLTVPEPGYIGCHSCGSCELLVQAGLRCLDRVVIGFHASADLEQPGQTDGCF